jgi:hypothetical protein
MKTFERVIGAFLIIICSWQILKLIPVFYEANATYADANAFAALYGQLLFPVLLILFCVYRLRKLIRK